jgi:hypothetical protein
MLRLLGALPEENQLWVLLGVERLEQEADGVFWRQVISPC